MDEIHLERAEEAMRLQLEMRLRAITSAQTEPYTGRCLNCDEEIDIARRYCDRDCAEDHELRLKMSNR